MKYLERTASAILYQVQLLKILNKSSLMRSLVLCVAILCIYCHQSNASQEKILYSNMSKYGSIWVYDNAQIRCLSFGSINTGTSQTCISLDDQESIVHSYPKLVLGALYINPNPKRILMIGLGGGVLVSALQKLLPASLIDVVEINADVVYAAQAYFYVSKNSNTKIFVEDGLVFVQNVNPKTYDMVVIDAFNESSTPSALMTPEFVDNVKKILSPMGVVAINTLTEEVNRNFRLESDLYQNAFQSTVHLFSPDAYNRVILATKYPVPSDTIIKQRALRWLKKFEALDIDTDWLVSEFANQIIY